MNRLTRPSSLPVHFLLLATALPLRAQSAPPRLRADTTRVVFVCEHGSVKSLIATSYFNRRTRELHLPYQAIARGTHPDSIVPRAVQEGLRAAGFDVSKFGPRKFLAADLQGASLVVSFDQDITATVGGTIPHEQWDNLPAVSDGYARGRDSIVARVDSLIGQLQRRSRRS